MAKAQNQKFFSDVLYGSEVASGSLRLESTLHGTKGLVQVVGTSLQIITGGQTAELIHSNTALRTYILPDLSGELLSAGSFTAANQLLYSTGAGATTVLNPGNASVLTSSAVGLPQWTTGANGEFLQMSGGVPVFGSLPSTVGSITPALGNNLAMYQPPGPSNSLIPLATVTDRTLLSPAGIPTWSLLTAKYLSGVGGVPLINGTAGQKLKSNGDGTFYWEDDNSSITTGSVNKVTFYSAPSTLDPSSFLEVNEGTKTLSYLNGGRIRLYQPTGSGSNYIELRAATLLGASLVFTLPTAHGSPGAVLVNDGFGNLSFTSVNNGSVSAGLANQLAHYAANGDQVSGLTTFPNRVLISPSGTLTWGLLLAPYLSAAGNVPLGNGAINNVLISNGDGTFNWTSASSLVGSVNAGNTNQAAYYASGGSSLSPSSFVDFIDASKRVDLKSHGTLRFYDTGSNYIEFKTPNVLSTNRTYTLPATDGTSGQALTTDGAGTLSFSELGLGVVNAGAANTLAYYTGATTAGGNGIINSLASVASRVMLTTAGNALSWGLIQEQYLSSVGLAPLSGGISGQVLTSDGLGNFQWTNAGTLVGTVAPGNQGFMAYYPASAAAVDDSSFLFTDDALKEFHLKSQGQIRFYEVANVKYVGFRAPSSVTTTTLWTLPAADASLAGQVLVSDASGALSFQDQVDQGVAGALAFYSAGTRRVSPTTSVTYSATSFNFTGTNFSFLGNTSGTPTSLLIKAGDGVAVAGGNLELRAGDSTLPGSLGTIFLGVGVNDLVKIEKLVAGQFVSLQSGTSLRWYDSGTNYVGFKAPVTVTGNVVWNLPQADGTLNQVLATDGTGNLSWVNAPTNATIGVGVAGALAYYASASGLDDSQLLVPVGLPASNNSALVVATSGQLSYQMLVEPGGTTGALAFYTSSQTVDSVAEFRYDLGGNALELGNQGFLRWYEASANGTEYFELQAAAAMAASVSLTLPDSAPSVGQVLTATSPSALTFANPDSQISLEKRGSVTVPNGVDSVSITYGTPFSAAASVILTQWSIEGATLPASMPTTAVSVNTATGFTLQLSTTTTQAYKIYWEAYLNGNS